jgi:hypothetical protein
MIRLQNRKMGILSMVVGILLFIGALLTKTPFNIAVGVTTLCLFGLFFTYSKTNTERKMTRLLLLCLWITPALALLAGAGMHEHYDCIPQIEEQHGVIESTGLDQEGYYANLEDGQTVEILAVDFNSVEPGDTIVVDTQVVYHCGKRPEISGGLRVIFDIYGWMLGLYNSV